MASGNAPPLRKTTRSLKPSLKALESQFLNQSSKLDYEKYSSSESDSEDCNSDIEKPKVIHENEIIQGKDIFKFQTRKIRDGLALKVAEACTPKTQRQKAKSRIARIIQEDSGSEYEVSSDETSEESDEKISSDSESDVDDRKVHKIINEFKDVKLKSSRVKSAGEYTIKTDV
nr:uncharacterized protein LOC111503046 [Leptinotarsa decemlineata]